MAAASGPDDVVAWLLVGDPAIRWQVQRDLLDASPQVVDAERALVATQGWGARLLALQDADGRWGGGLYSPKWISTTYTLLLLHWLGLAPGHPAALRGVAALWDGAQRVGGGLTFSARRAEHGEECITSMLVMLAASTGYPAAGLDETVGWLLGRQGSDGGWNCENPRTGSTHGSFHTSISALDALQGYRGAGGTVGVAGALWRGQQFFLAHRLFRSHRTGQVVSPALARFPFPPQWHFDVLRGLEHFRAAGAARDPRLADGIEQVRRRRRADGTWPRYRGYPGRVWFELEHGSRSRWATLRAMRVLRWWESS